MSTVPDQRGYWKPALPRLQRNVLAWLLPPALYCVLSLALLYGDFNLFHVAVETGCVVIGMMALLVAAISRQFGNNSLLVIACTGLGWAALFDLLHMMAYEGMGLLPGSTANLSTQLWLVGRLLQAGALLAAVVLRRWPVRLLPLNGIFALLALAALAGIGSGVFPAAFVPGSGLTWFKIGAEYFIIGLLLATAFQVQRQRGEFTTGKYYGIQLALGAMVLSEFSFTLYRDVFDQFNETGHLLKVFSYWFLFRALVEQSLLQPFQDRNNLLHLLGERLKEMRCLNELARLSQVHDDAPEALLAAVTQMLPAAMLHDKLALAGVESKFGNFGAALERVPEDRRLSVSLQVDELRFGTLFVGYEADAELAQPVFLDEERDLMELVGQRVNAVLARQQGRRAIKQLNRLYRMLSGVNRAVIHSSSRSRLLWEVFNILRNSESFGLIALAESSEAPQGFVFTHVHDLSAAEQETVAVELQVLVQQQWPTVTGLRLAPVTLPAAGLAAPMLARALQRCGSASVALVPIVVHDQLFGVLLVAARAGHDFEVEQERLLAELGEDVGFALSHLQQGQRLLEAEERVEDSDRRYQILFDQSPVPMALLNADGTRILQHNRAYDTWLGASLCEIESVPEWFSRVVDEPARVETLMRQLQENVGKSFAPFGYFQFSETCLRDSEGRLLVATARLTAVADRILVVFNDITQLKQKEQRLRESERRFRNMIEDTLLGVLVLQDGKFVYANPAFCRLSGWQQHELVGRRFDALATEADSTGSKAPTAASQRQFAFRTGADTTIQLHASAGSMPWDERAAEVMIVEDVTERLHYEQQLQESANLLDSLAQQVPGVIYQYRLYPDGRSSFPFATRSLMDIYEVSPEDVKEDATPVFLRLHPDDLERVRESIEKSARDLSLWACDYRVVLPRQGTRWRSGIARPQRQDDGSTLWYGFIEDSTARKEMEDELRRSNAMLQRSVTGTLEIISRIMDQRDPYTAGHQHRVGQIARLIGRELGLGKQAEEMLELTGVVHDVGKIAVPTEILTKPTRLSEIELQIVKGHASAGYEMLKDTNLPRVIIDAIHQHHERLDGSGYPQGLQGEQICLEARIIAVADVLESMSSHRPYRPALGLERAVAELERGRGSSYDSRIVDIALGIVREGRLPAESTVD